MKLTKACLGELLGTFLLVCIGCNAIVQAVIYGNLTSLFQVAVVWGLGVALAIFLTRAYSGAHLNPAVSWGFYIVKRCSFKEASLFTASQFAGAAIAGLLVYQVNNDAIAAFELQNNITRGLPESQVSAQFFGEFFPNPGYADQFDVTAWEASFYEGTGTFLLVLGILVLINIKKLHRNVVPFLIGGLVTALICWIAPYTQAGINPARDLAPRIIAYFCGWGSAAFPDSSLSYLGVYAAAPLIGGILAGLLFKAVPESYKQRSEELLSVE